MQFVDAWSIMGGEGAILGHKKSARLYNELIKTSNVDGAIGEIGVYRGRTAKLMKLVMPQKEMHLYDTFAGIVSSDEKVDWHRNGEFGDTTLELVKKLVGVDNVHYHVGMFPDTFKQPGKFSFVHSDTDTYYGTMETLKVILPLISVGGKLMFDDYKWFKCPGVEKAISDFLGGNKVPFVTHEMRHQFVMTRIGEDPSSGIKRVPMVW